MKGIDLLAWLSMQENETLDQEVLFNVKVQLKKGDGILDGPVRAEGVIISPSDNFLTPNGIMTREEAEEQYMEVQIDVALGHDPEEAIKEVALSSCPLLISKDQMLIKLETIDLRGPQADPFVETDERSGWLADALAHADAVFGPPEEQPADFVVHVTLACSELRTAHTIIDEWRAMKGPTATVDELQKMAALKDAITIL